MKRFSGLRPFLSHIIIVGLSLLAIIVTIIILWWDITRQPALPTNFSYNADLISSQTYYDPASGRAQTPQYIKTSLDLTLKSPSNNPAIHSTITNVLSDDQTTTIEDTRPVNPRSGTYKPNNHRSKEYILAPRAIRNDQPFSYRSPFYSEAMTMKFQGRESINGLQVYRYKASLDKGVTYTGKLQSLNAVPDRNTLQYEPTLQIWVEPEGGWIVKSYSETTVHLVNKVSGAPDGLFAHIKETMSEESTLQHVAYAKDLKLKSIFARQIAPSVMLLIAFAVLFGILIALIRRRTVPVYGAVFAVLFVSCSVIAGWIFDIQPLKTFFAGSPAVNPLTALFFALVAGSITALYRRHHPVASIIGLTIVTLASIQLLNTLGILPYSPDLLLFRSAILDLDQTVHSRMSTESAATFLLLGVGLIKAGLSSQKSKIHFARFLVGMVLAIGMFGFFIRLTRLDALLTAQLLAPFSVVPSLLFIISAFTLFQLFRTLNERSDSISSTLRAVRWPVVATLPIIMIALGAQMARNNIAQSTSQRFSEEVSTFEKQLNQKLSAYIQALSGARALYSSSEAVTKNEFHKYVATYLSRQKDGVTDVGYVAAAPGATKTPITYLESPLASHQQWIGYDLSSDLLIKNAMDYARDSNKTIMSRPTSSLQTARSLQKQSVILTPVYRNELPATTPDQRRQAIAGFVFMVINAPNLIEPLISSLPFIDIAVHDGVEVTSESLLYKNGASHSLAAPAISDTRTLLVANRPWTITYSSQPGLEASRSTKLIPSIILIGGSLLYFLFLALIYYLVSHGYVLQRQKHARHFDF